MNDYFAQSFAKHFVILFFLGILGVVFPTIICEGMEISTIGTFQLIMTSALILGYLFFTWLSER